MIPSDPVDRRSFVKAAASVSLGASLSPLLATAAGKAGKPWPNEFCTFTKVFQHMDFDELADTIAELGFDGIEAPVRPGGHVLPERVEEDLPKMAEALKKRGLKISILTSGINEVSEEQYTEKVLRTAKALGIERYRMSYYRYDLKKPIPEQLAGFRAPLDDLVALNKEVGIKAIYQNHSGAKYCGAPLWDLYELIKGHSPEHIGSCFDIGHATVEGAKAWPLNFHLLRPWIDTVYVKEPGLKDNKVVWGPINEGAVDKEFYTLLKQSKFTGPISLHVEYLGHKDPNHVGKIIEATRKDFAALKENLAQA